MRSTGSAPVFKVPRRGVPSARVWVTAFLCLAMPPVGLVLLWRGLRCPVRGKLLLSTVALLSMTMMLTAFIGFRRDSSLLVPIETGGQYAVADQTPTGGPADGGAPAPETPAPAQPQLTPVPANPAG